MSLSRMNLWFLVTFLLETNVINRSRIPLKNVAIICVTSVCAQLLYIINTLACHKFNTSHPNAITIIIFHYVNRNTNTETTLNGAAFVCIFFLGCPLLRTC